MILLLPTPFTRAELALAAGSYLGKITPNLADDATVALRAIVELLPIACDKFFAQVSLACPFCHAKAVGASPIFSTAVTWKSDNWVNLKTTLEEATPFVSSFPNNWHVPTCDRTEFVTTAVDFGPWAYLEFRPYPLQDEFFPLLSDIASLLADTSLIDLGLHQHSGWKQSSLLAGRMLSRQASNCIRFSERCSENHSRTVSVSISHRLTPDR